MTLISQAVSRLSKLLTLDVLQKVNEQGYLIVDNALPSKLAHQLHDEIVECSVNGLMESNHTAYVEAKPVATNHQSDNQTKATITRLYAKPHIYEAEVLEPLLESNDVSIPSIKSVHEILIPFLDCKFACAFDRLMMYEGDTSIKVQINQGGGCFPFHYDSPGGLKDTRRITCLIYLNADWSPEHSGELCMQPFLKQQVLIAPLFNRMVLFRSDRMLHRVNVSTVKRVCLTIWAHGRGDDEPKATTQESEVENNQSINQSNKQSINQSDDQLTDDWTTSWMSQIVRPSAQRVLSRAIYSEQWKQSYRQAHNGTGGDVALPQSIDQDVATLLAKPGMDKVMPILLSIADDKMEVINKGYGAGDIDGSSIPDEDNDSESDTDDEMPMLTKDINQEDLGFLDFL